MPRLHRHPELQLSENHLSAGGDSYLGANIDAYINPI